MTTNPLTNLTIRDLRNAVALRERIDALRDELDRLLDLAPSPRRGGTRTQPKGLAEASIAVKPARRGHRRGSKTRKLGPAARARLSAMAKARWAKVKKAGKNRL